MKTKWHYQIYEKKPLCLWTILIGVWPFTFGRLIHEGHRHRIIETRLLPHDRNRSDIHEKLISLLDHIESRPGVIVDICHHHKTTWAKIVKSPGLDQNEVSDLTRHIQAVLETVRAEQDGADQPATAPEPKSEGNEKPNPESEVRSQ